VGTSSRNAERQLFRIWGLAGSHLLDDLVHVIGEQRGPLAVALVDVVVHDLHAVNVRVKSRRSARS